MTDTPQEQQRKLKRHEVEDIVDVYDSVLDVYLGRLVNIHAEGLMLMGDAAVSEDRLYQLDLHLPQPINGRKMIQVGVDCLWTRHSDDSTKHWAGCQIIDVSAEGLKDIGELVALLG